MGSLVDCIIMTAKLVSGLEWPLNHSQYRRFPQLRPSELGSEWPKSFVSVHTFDPLCSSVTLGLVYWVPANSHAGWSHLTGKATGREEPTHPEAWEMYNFALVMSSSYPIGRIAHTQALHPTPLTRWATGNLFTPSMLHSACLLSMQPGGNKQVVECKEEEEAGLLHHLFAGLAFFGVGKQEAEKEWR